MKAKALATCAVPEPGRTSPEKPHGKGSRPDGIRKFVVACLASNYVAELRARGLGAKNLKPLGHIFGFATYRIRLSEKTHAFAHGRHAVRRGTGPTQTQNEETLPENVCIPAAAHCVCRIAPDVASGGHGYRPHCRLG